jgi:hypothetical protein
VKKQTNLPICRHVLHEFEFPLFTISDYRVISIEIREKRLNTMMGKDVPVPVFVLLSEPARYRRVVPWNNHNEITTTSQFVGHASSYLVSVLACDNIKHSDANHHVNKVTA